ncbi:TonB-dependent receptor [Kordiimonas aquimaris]|uniref:TonB-dependent receptor n=1 Tax=Kordiimonas aquimaris TaxID=707591 RepID=UPI0021D31F29|nr:TonB-dependent receptor [Kordiimonas aquimaris]
MTSTNFTRLTLLAGAGISALIAGAPTVAQEADTNAGLEEIQVTARRRSESLQDVPIAVTAISGETLFKVGAQDITVLAQSTPNTTLEVSRGTNTTITAFIRGVGQQDPVAGFEAGVGIYIDDVYVNRPQGGVLDIYDVERIEILRGPQGTLYGRNTIGGAIKYVTRRIGEERSLKLNVAGGTFGQHEITATAELPVSDSVRFGASAAYLQRNGFGENINTGAEHYDKDILAFRGSVELTPSPKLFIRLSGDYLKDESSPKSGHRLIPGLFSGAPVLDDVFDTRAGITGRNDAEQYGGTALIEYEISDRVTLKNILAYREDKSFQQIDFDSLPAADVDVPILYRNDQFSEEFQLLYSDDKVNGVLGFYYLDATAFNEFDVVLANTGNLIGLPGLNANTLGDVDTKTWSVFGDFTFDISDVLNTDTKVELNIGGRYTSDKRTSNILRRTFIGGLSETFGGTATQIATTSDFNGSRTYKDFNPRASLSWHPNDDHTWYISYSEGFKGGGFDPRAQSTAAPDLNNDGTTSETEIFEFINFDPETITTYEAGVKSTWADGLVNTNLAVFYSDYNDVQVPGSIGVDTNGDGINDSFSGITTNAGAANFTGVEFEGSAILGQDIGINGDNLTTNFSLGWIDTEYSEFISAVTDPVTGVTSLQDISDQRVVQNTPEWSTNLRLTYNRPSEFFGEDGELSFSGAWSYKSLTNQFEIPSAFLDQPGYSLFDASIVWTSESGKYQFGVHGRNLFDKEYIVAGYFFANETGTVSTLGLEGIASAFYGPPRTVTAVFGVKF